MGVQSRPSGIAVRHGNCVVHVPNVAAAAELVALLQERGASSSLPASADLVASGVDASVEIVRKVAAYADHPVQSFRDTIYTLRARDNPAPSVAAPRRPTFLPGRI